MFPMFGEFKVEIDDIIDHEVHGPIVHLSQVHLLINLTDVDGKAQ
jgi:hypothetical protein